MLASLVFICVLSLGYASFSQECLEAHNNYRKKHHAPDLELDEELGKFSQEYADKLAAENTMKHSQEKGMGENLFMASGGDPDAASAVKAWYDEIKDYNFKEGKFSMKTGHFTQVVWKSTTKLGCAIAKNEKKSVFVVANYKPPGNMAGAFIDNVIPSPAEKSVLSPLLICLYSIFLAALCTVTFDRL